MRRRASLIYGLLFAAWVAILAWQGAEHLRIRKASREALVLRGHDITTTLGLVIRSQRRFGSIVSQERLEPALRELVKTDEVESISLHNIDGEVVASAGSRPEIEVHNLARAGERWGTRSVTLVNLMDLGGTNNSATPEGSQPQRIIVMPRRDAAGSTNGDRRGPRYPWRFGPPPPGGTNGFPTNGPSQGMQGAPPGTNPPASLPPPGPGPGPGGPGPGGRPPWMSEEDYQAMISKQGLHSFVVVLSTRTLDAIVRGDLWLRTIIGLLGGVAVAGLTLAWRTMVKSSELQIRLLRASELNNHLREMNVAAAGLAHETRNPLNIVRGLAQMISKQEEATAEIRRRSVEITTEVDRVTAQLNQFIAYSKPRDVKLSRVLLDGVVDEVARALGGDLEEKRARLSIQRSGLLVEADEQMLRQALFNLVMNAVQFVEPGGEVTVASGRAPEGDVWMEVRDTGPGVPVSERQEVFKPYFTTRPDGSGLGLAVVQQIVLAHGWDIECLANTPRGALFRIRHLKATPGA